MNALLPTLLIIAALSLAGIWLTLTRRGESSNAPAGQEFTAPVLTHHAKQRMVEREVSSAQIDHVVANPSRLFRDGKNNSVRLEREVDGRTLRVWVAEPWPAAKTVVKTTAWADFPLVFEIPAATAGRVIGRGGATVSRIQSDHHVRISIDHAGSVRVTAGDKASADAAKREILDLVSRATPRTLPLLAA